MTKPYKGINTSVPVWERLSKLRHPGQSINGVIEELLDKVAPDTATPSRSKELLVIKDDCAEQGNENANDLREEQNERH